MPDSSDPAQSTSRPKYHAVITYVPEEFIWCDWLHRQLDGTNVPTELANKRTRHGFPRPPLIEVFPDPRNPAHLARHATAPPPSRHLIVICSPHSAGSPAIEEQIRAFKRTEGEDRIVVLVTDGDPEHDSAPAGHDDAAWLPTWLRWRLDKKGNFRPAEASEPQIIDARTDKLDPPEARAHLLAALLDVPRESLRAYGDLISAHASETLVPAADEAEPAPVAAPSKRSSTGIVVFALIIAAAGGAYWWSMQPVGPGTTPAAASPSPAPLAASAPEKASTPSPTTPAATTPTAKATPSPALAITKVPPSPPRQPQPSPMVKASQPTPAVTTIAKAKPFTPPPPPKRVVTTFAPSEGPQTPITSVTPTRTPRLPKEAASNWQRIRDLGDTLMSRGNRDAGIIALSQAVETGLRAGAAHDATVEERLEIARMCFRVGALQKQFVSSAEARKTLQGARDLLATMRATEDLAIERDGLISDIDQLLVNIPR